MRLSFDRVAGDRACHGCCVSSDPPYRSQRLLSVPPVLRARRTFVAGLALVALSGCGDTASETSTTDSRLVDTTVTMSVPSTGGSSARGAHTIHGVFTLSTDEQFTKGAECEGPPPYDDLRGGAPVIVKAGGGEEIGRGALDAGRAPEETLGPITPICEFVFEVGALPEVESYTIVINHVDDQTLTAADLEEQGCAVDFGLSMAIGG